MQALQNEHHAAQYKGMNGNGASNNNANGVNGKENGNGLNNGHSNGHMNGTANGFTNGKSRLPAYRLPSQVHLIWAVRNRDELQLLDQDLLATAG